MKVQATLKPLVFAMAAVMAAGAYADNNRGHGNHSGPGGNHHGQKYDPYETRDAGAIAAIGNVQSITGNWVGNQATDNDAKVDGALNGSSGNVGLNIAGGDVNQQANEASIAKGDQDFLFGSSVSYVTVNQANTGNSVGNYSTQNHAELKNSANNSSGNIGLNMTAGNFNQQKNAMAMSVSGGRQATAGNSITQTLNDVDVNNKAQLKAEYAPVTLSVGMIGGYWGSGEGHVLDEGGRDHRGNYHYDKDPMEFDEAGHILLGGVVTGKVPVGATLRQVVTNNANVANSLNGVGGNVGVNVSAGTNNQQLNSLSMAVGCKTCM